MIDKLPAQFRACKTIETHPGFCCFNGKVSMHLGGDTNHEFTAVMFNCYGFRLYQAINDLRKIFQGISPYYGHAIDEKRGGFKERLLNTDAWVLPFSPA